MPRDLLVLLADGDIHSGEALGNALDISRAAVCKQVKKLTELGVNVTSIKGLGYQLAFPIELLDSTEIKSSLHFDVDSLISKIDVHWSIASTNSYCLDVIKHNNCSGYVCLAENQFAGRGRRGREWISALAGGVNLSLTWQFAGGAEVLEGFSLAIAIAIVDTLSNVYSLHDAKLKWPNDILWGNKKIGGVLIEVVGEAGGPCSVVIGIGINVRASGLSQREIEQPWTDLYSALGQDVSRNKLVASLLNCLVPLLQHYEQEGFAAFHKNWKKYDAFLDGQVVVHHGGSNCIEGVARGISRSGELLLEVDGCRRAFKSGEVSLRRA
jgi:BirA family biotin operon repressor/biotin-[acetyl-CoA-carboxylase] ligase